MNILLVTLCGNYNIGNRLQHYALQETLKDVGDKVCSLDTFDRKTNIKRIVKRLFSFLGSKTYQAFFRRENKFNDFNDKYISNRIKMEIDKAFDTDWSEYDYAVVGSDQVWHNWHNHDRELEFFYLNFIEPNKRLCYAPSFGFSEIPLIDKQFHENGIKGMKALSCREKDGCEIIESITGRECEHVLDPTLLLSAEKWDEISEKPEYDLPEKYVLMYFLGEISEDTKKQISKIVNKFDATLINIYDKREPVYYTTNPSNFLYLIKNAQFVVTDSFHGTVFSIIYKRNFLTFSRSLSSFNSKSDRIESLLNMLEIKNHIKYEGYEISEVDDIDYAGVYRLLDYHKENSLNYLKVNIY